jgi:hypothetical protein
LSDDDHTHYSRADGTRAFTGVVGGIDPILSTHLATKNYVDTTTITDHTALTNIGVNTHAQIDTHIADSTIHFTEGSIDHGSISGLLDDDHTQYSLADGTRAFTGTVGGIDPTLSTHLTTKNYVDTEIANNTYWSRTSTTLSTKTANDDLQIDSFIRVNGSSDTQQLIVKGHSTQTANLQEWQNGSAVLQANMTNSGAFRNYVSYTDASNYEAGIFDWQEISGDLTIGALRTGEYAGRNVIVQATDSTGDGVYYGRVGGALTLKAGKPWDQATQYANSYGGQIKIDTFTYN